MDERKLMQLKDKICEEIEQISGKEMSNSNLEALFKLTTVCKNICKMMEAEGGEEDYSQRNSYQDGYSGRRHYVRGHYSRDGMRHRSYNDGSYDGGSYDGGSYYSQGGGKQRMIMELREAMEAAEGNRERERIRKLIEELEQ